VETNLTLTSWAGQSPIQYEHTRVAIGKDGTTLFSRQDCADIGILLDHLGTAEMETQPVEQLLELALSMAHIEYAATTFDQEGVPVHRYLIAEKSAGNWLSRLSNFITSGQAESRMWKVQHVGRGETYIQEYPFHLALLGAYRVAMDELSSLGGMPRLKAPLYEGSGKHADLTLEGTSIESCYMQGSPLARIIAVA
jgi:hypothetical protein